MIPLEDARSHVLERCPPLAPIRVPVSDAIGLVLAETVCAGENVPPFDNTAVDGFAVRAADTADAPATLTVVATLAAGDAPDREVGPGQAIRIMTGAPVPRGADAIVMVERTQLAPDGGTVVIESPVAAGDAVRRAGDDLTSGQVVFEPGEVIGPGHVGVLASVGAYEVLVHPRLRVGVMSTGDELVDGPVPLRPGQIRDSNRYTLLALLSGAGVVGVDLGLVPDDEAAIEQALVRSVAECDAVVSSGGVSMGAFDYVKVVLDRIADMRWMQIAIKPAKPFAFGTMTAADGRVVPVFGLPGNTVSSMVSFELLCRPGLRKMGGHAEPVPPTVTAVAGEDLRRRPDGKTHFVRAIATPGHDGRLIVRSAGGQGSHQLWAMAAANVLAVVPDGAGVDAGDTVQVIELERRLGP